LFGEKVVKEENIEILYNGPSFDNKMEIRNLYTQLEAVENIVKDTADVLKKNNKINRGSNDIKIFLKLKKGSFGEVIVIVFNDPIFQSVISGCITATYIYFLTNRSNKNKNFQKEIEEFEKDKNFKSNVKKVVLPINIAGDDEPENELLKNGEFEEELIGVIRKLDLDAQKNNYFGFNIKNGPSKISTSVKGEFNLNVYKDLIDEPIKVRTVVRYKDDIITHIEVLEYEILNKSKQSRLFEKPE